MLNVEAFFSTIETALTLLLPSISKYRMRPANNTLWLSFGAVDDFVALVMAATGANIEIAIGSTFEGKLKLPKSLKSCYLSLKFDNGCLDERLIFILTDILNMKLADGTLTSTEHALRLSELLYYQELLQMK